MHRSCLVALAVALALVAASLAPSLAAPTPEPILFRIVDEKGATIPLTNASEMTIACEDLSRGFFQASVEPGREVFLPDGMAGFAWLSVRSPRLSGDLAARYGQFARTRPARIELGQGPARGVVPLVLEPCAPLVVTVLDGRGDRARGAEVFLDLDGPALGHAEKTDAAGRVTFSADALAATTATLEAKDPRSAARLRKRIVLGGGAPQEVTLAIPRAPPSATLALRIVDEAGRPFAYRGPIEVRSEDDGALVFRSPALLEGQGPASGDARVLSLSVEPGRYGVLLETLGALLPARTLVVKAGDLAEVKVPPPVPGAIIVRAAKDPSLPAVEVRAEVEHGPGGRRALKAGGACAVLGLGHAVLSASAPGRAPFLASYDLAPGVTAGAEIALAPEATLTVRLEDAAGRPVSSAAEAVPFRAITLETGAGPSQRSARALVGSAVALQARGGGEPVETEGGPPPGDRARFLGLPAGRARVFCDGAAAEVTLVAGKEASVALRLPLAAADLERAHDEALARATAGAQDEASAPARVLVLVRDEEGRPLDGARAIARPVTASAARAEAVASGETTVEAAGVAAGAERGPVVASAEGGVVLLELRAGSYEIAASSALRPEGAAARVTLAPFDERRVQVVPAPASAAAWVTVRAAPAEGDAPGRAPRLAASVRRAGERVRLEGPLPSSGAGALLGPLPSGAPLEILLEDRLGADALAVRATAVTLAPGEARALVLARPATARASLVEDAGAPLEGAEVRAGLSLERRVPLLRSGASLSGRVAAVPSLLLARAAGDPPELYRGLLPLASMASGEARLTPTLARGGASISGAIVLPRGVREALLRGPGAALALESGAPFAARDLPAGEWALEAGGRTLARYALEDARPLALGVVVLPER